MIKLPLDKLRDAIKGIPVPQHYEAIQDAVLKNVVEQIEALPYMNINPSSVMLCINMGDWQALRREAGLEEK